MRIVKVINKQAKWQDNVTNRVFNYLKQFPEFNKAMTLFRQYQSGQVTTDDLSQQGLTDADLDMANKIVSKFTTTANQDNRMEVLASQMTWGVIFAVLALLAGTAIGNLTKNYMDAQQSSSETPTTNSPSSTMTQPTRNNLALRNEFI